MQFMDPKSNSKRYILLGEFLTAELAQKKYNEALDRFAIKKKVATDLVYQELC